LIRPNDVPYDGSNKENNYLAITAFKEERAEKYPHSNVSPVCFDTLTLITLLIIFRECGFQLVGMQLIAAQVLLN